MPLEDRTGVTLGEGVLGAGRVPFWIWVGTGYPGVFPSLQKFLPVLDLCTVLYTYYTLINSFINNKRWLARSISSSTEEVFVTIVPRL